ncbi:MAG: hypothetical protein LBP22_05860 [Deltaproteobacteria bacterium]|nr:hypothetical protein [Deltaproteobacteria bacterium]
MSEEPNAKKLSEGLLNPGLDPLGSPDSAAEFEKAPAFFTALGSSKPKRGI